ncbi:hypothetical protein ACQKND_06620 [Viridibacillus arvi]|uniref:hypothetical protein n=1 Tax=Viridibacillus arvi TaxID=263475 RepID=UPI003D05F661
MQQTPKLAQQTPKTEQQTPTQHNNPKQNHQIPKPKNNHFQINIGIFCFFDIIDEKSSYVQECGGAGVAS